MECYDLFDGVDWISEPVDQKNQLSLKLEIMNDEPWLSLNNLESILTNKVDDELHVINNLKLKSNVLPSPLHYRKLHVDKLEQSRHVRLAPEYDPKDETGLLTQNGTDSHNQSVS